MIIVRICPVDTRVITLHKSSAKCNFTGTINNIKDALDTIYNVQYDLPDLHIGIEGHRQNLISDAVKDYTRDL